MRYCGKLSYCTNYKPNQKQRKKTHIAFCIVGRECVFPVVGFGFSFVEQTRRLAHTLDVVGHAIKKNFNTIRIC